VARQARALRSRRIADARGGLEFDGSTEGSSVRVPAAGAWHRDDGWSPLPNQRMQLTERARRAVCLADDRPSPTLAATTQFTRAPGGSRLARSAIDARIRYADWPSIGSTAALGEFGSVCVSGAVR